MSRRSELAGTLVRRIEQRLGAGSWVGIGAPASGLAELPSSYHEAWSAAGHDPAEARLAINTHAFVAPTLAEADAAFAGPYMATMNRIGRERGWPPRGQAEYEALRSTVRRVDA